MTVVLQSGEYVNFIVDTFLKKIIKEFLLTLKQCLQNQKILQKISYH